MNYLKKINFDFLYKQIFHLLSVNVASYLVLFFTSIIIFRTVDKSDYGLYIIMLSLFAIIELLMTGVNHSITRFLKDKISVAEKQGIVLFVLLYRYLLIFIFILAAILAKQFSFFELLIDDFQEVQDVVYSFSIVVILNGILSTIIGVNNCILNSQHYFKLTSNIGLLRNTIYLIIVIILSFITQEYIHYLYSSIGVSLLLILYLSYRIKRDFPEYSFSSLSKTKLNFNVARKYIFPYSAPLTATSLLSYVKNHLPILILGKEFTLEDVAIFSILKTFFKALHTFSGSFIDPMMSKFLELKDNDESYKSHLNSIFYVTFILRLFLFCLLAFLSQYIFLIYKLDNNSINLFIYYVLGVEYVLAGIILTYGIVLRLEKNTHKMLIIGLVRFALELILIYLLLFEYGIIAAAIILFIARYAETILAYLFVKKQNLLKSSGLILAIFIFPMAFFLANF